jgi:hypothetical protein
MVKMKKGFLKKAGCVLISASIILTGVTFFGSSTSDAGLVSGPDGTAYMFENGGSVSVADDLAGNTDIIEVSDDGSGAVIGAGSFANCTGLKKVTIIGNAQIGSQAFSGCANLEEVVLGSVSEIHQDSFEGCTSLRSIEILSPSSYKTADGALYNGTTLIFVPANKADLTVPSGTTAIATDAFSGSNVSYLKIEDASTISWPENNQSSWPLFLDPSEQDYTLVVESPNGANTDVEDYFDDYVAAYGKTRCQLRFGNAIDTPDTKWTITLRCKLFDEDYNPVTPTDTFNDLIATLTVNDGVKPSYSSYPTTKVYNNKAYVLDTGNLPNFVEASEDATYYYNYIESDVPVETHKITHVFKDEAGTELGTDEEDVVEGELPTQPESKKTFNGKEYEFVEGSTTPEFVPAQAPATYTHTYKATGNSGSDTPTPNPNPNPNPNPDPNTKPDPTKTYTVTVYDEFYKGDLNHMTSSKVRSTNKFAGGTTYSFKPAVFSGYTFVGARDESGTVYGDTKVYFFYLENGSSTTTDDTASEINKDLKNVYEIIEGANQTVSANAGPLRIVCNGPVEKLTGIFVDGKKVDSRKYTIESGSTILTFAEGFMKVWTNGDHTVRFEYTDGYAETGVKIVDSKTTTTVTYKISSDGSISSGHTKDTTPKTADGFDTRYLLCLAIFLLGAGAILFSKQKKLEAILAGERDEY